MISAIITEMLCLIVRHGFAYKRYNRNCCYLENSQNDYKENT